MKTTITIIVLILSVASCRPQRSTMLQTAQENRQQFQQRQLYLWDDSLSRQWYFYSDSPFVFYPDSALIGYSGYIGFNESRNRSSLHQWQQDSIRHEANMHTEKEMQRSGREYIIVLLTVLLIAMVCAWHIITKKKS